MNTETSGDIVSARRNVDPCIQGFDNRFAILVVDPGIMEETDASCESTPTEVSIPAYNDWIRREYDLLECPYAINPISCQELLEIFSGSF